MVDTREWPIQTIIIMKCPNLHAELIFKKFIYYYFCTVVMFMGTSL